MSKIKRSLVKTFLNTGTPAAPVWVLIGDGVVSGKITYSPKTVSETYISDDNATIYVDSYEPNLPVEAMALSTDAAFVWLDALRKARGVLSSAETEIVNVWLYQKPGFTHYPAEKQMVSIQIDDFGGDGGSATKINYTINFIGDPEIGVFKPAATATFYSDDPTLDLTTLVLGSGTLSPLFAVDHGQKFYTTTIAAATVTMASTLSGATIVQKDGAGSTVGQGAPASLTMGANILTITVTKGGLTAVYSILATRTV
jgi:hypothetical protein